MNRLLVVEVRVVFKRYRVSSEEGVKKEKRIMLIGEIKE